MEINLDCEVGQFFLADAFALMKSLPNESINLGILDPPYPSLEDHRARGTTTRLKSSKSSSNPWFKVIAWDDFELILSEMYRVLKPNSHFFLWCDETTADVVKSQQGLSDPRVCRLKSGQRRAKSGFYYWRDWIWVKTTIDGTKLRGGSGFHGRGANERLLFFEKGKRALNIDCLDVIPAPRPRKSEVAEGAPTPKPGKVTRTIIEASSNPGDIVLDCFAGTGVVGKEAMALDRRFILADIESKWLDSTVRPYIVPKEAAA